MVDSPYYRPPDDGGAPPGAGDDAPGGLSDGVAGRGIAPMPFDPTLAPSGRSAQPAAHDTSGAEAAELSAPDDEAAEEIEEMWQVVAEIDDPNRADELVEDIEAAGIETWLRAANDYQFSTGMTRVYEILVREEQADAADEVAEETALRWAEEIEVRGASSAGCRQFVFIGGIVVLVALAIALTLG